MGENNPHIIGLTGSFGSGCTYIKKHILMPNGYKELSLSNILRELFEEKKGKKPGPRSELQDFGDEIRKNEGPQYLAAKAVEKILEHTSVKWVIDSIRNPNEIYTFRTQFPNFYLFGIYADKEARWKRVSKSGERYHKDRNAFDIDDENDAGKNSEDYGQRVSDCFFEADIVLRNEADFSAQGNTDFEDFQARILRYATLFQKPLSNRQATKNEEAMMATAYAVSQRSSCLQRKVGAIITDRTGAIISSGFNEVPRGEKPCGEEHTRCFRSIQRTEFNECLKKIIPKFEQYSNDVDREFRERFRILDVCRALHAEENAIINLAYHGRSVAGNESTLYTTTYPCRLCANKIVQVGITKVVYLEPYPDEEAKSILRDGGVETEFFEGITFRAYFRVYGDKK